MSLKLVPFNGTWINHDKIDLHAIYRRPRFVEDKYGEMQREVSKDGVPTWDLTGPLPVRQHNKWTAKGFEYITLANRESLYMAARTNTLPPGKTIQEYDQHQTGGPWNFRKYIEGEDAMMTLDAAQLKADVEEYGSAAVEMISRRTNPAFVLPENLRNIPARSIEVVVAQEESKGKKASEKAGAQA
jgi:hypothetical protein